MKKMIKRLVAVIMIATVISTPVFADSLMDNLVFNEKTGNYYDPNELLQVADYTLKEAGTRTMSAVVKDGVSYVELTELADVLGLEFYQSKIAIDLTGYNEYGGIATELGLYTKEKRTTEYMVFSKGYKPENAYFVKEYDDMIKGNFVNGKTQLINNKYYVPAREAISLLNQADTKVVYDKVTKTITFEQTMDWYTRTLSYVPR